MLYQQTLPVLKADCSVLGTFTIAIRNRNPAKWLLAHTGKTTFNIHMPLRVSPPVVWDFHSKYISKGGLVEVESKYLKQFKKGILEIIILKILSEKEMYGYQIVGELNQRTTIFQIKEGTLYPILYRLEDDGLMQTRWEQNTERGIPKKYYSITEKGKGVLKDAADEWFRFSGEVKSILSQ